MSLFGFVSTLLMPALLIGGVVRFYWLNYVGKAYPLLAILATVLVVLSIDRTLTFIIISILLQEVSAFTDFLALALGFVYSAGQKDLPVKLWIPLSNERRWIHEEAEHLLLGVVVVECLILVATFDLEPGTQRETFR